MLFFSNSLAVAVEEKKGAKKKDLIEELKFQKGEEAKNDEKALKAELLVAASEAKAIEYNKNLIKKYKGTELEPELWLRLGELYMRRSKSDRFFEIIRDSNDVVRVAPREVKTASSRKSILEAIQAYEKIEKSFTKFYQMDTVLFNNAFARQQIGEDKTAEAIYWRLIQKFPNSPLIPDAHLSIGEIAFEAQKYAHALEHFNAIKKYPMSRVYPYGLYKASWTLYNLRKTEEGMVELEAVVKYGREAAEKGWDARLDLRKEALNDMTLFFSEIFPAQDAIKYFSQQAAGLEVGPYILRLGEIYNRHSKYEDKQTVLIGFSKTYPKAADIPEVINEIALTYDSLRKPQKAVETLENFVHICDSKSSWSKSQPKANPKEGKKESPKETESKHPHIAKCESLVRETSLRLAGRWLKDWKKTPAKVEIADVTERAFRIYLREEPKSSEGLQARFAYADLLFERKKYRLASDQYAWIGPFSTDESLSHNSRYAAVLSFEKAVGEAMSDKDEASFFALAKEYVTRHPKGEFRKDVEFKVALINYEKKRLDEAAVLFEKLGREYVSAEKSEPGKSHLAKAQKAQDLYLDILNSQKKYALLRDYSKQLVVQSETKDRIAKLQKVYEEAYFLEIQSFENAKMWEKASLAYKTFVKENPGSPLAQKAWWNAVEIHFKAQQFKQGAQASVEYYRKFSSAPEALDALMRAAQTFESLGDIAATAETLQILAVADRKSSEKWNLLAADFLSLENKEREAKEIYLKLTEGKDQKIRDLAWTRLETFARSQRSQESYENLVKSFIKLGREPFYGNAKLFQLEKVFEAGKRQEAFAESRKLVGMEGATPYVRARARFIQAKILELEYKEQSLKAKVDRVATVIALKSEKLDKAQQAYQSAIKMGDAGVSLSALQSLAYLYGDFAQALKSMPIPQGLSGPEESAFREEIDKLILPMEDKSLETIAQALNEAKKLKRFDGSVRNIENALLELNMTKRVLPQVELREPAMVLPNVKEVGT